MASLNALGKKFLRNEGYAKKYTEQIKKIISSGFAEPAPEVAQESNGIYPITG